MLPLLLTDWLLRFVSPGQLAAALQLHRGTKYELFPGWLDRWLCVRKELGLLSLLAAVLHAIYSVCLKLRKASDYHLLSAAYRQVSWRPSVRGVGGSIQQGCRYTQWPLDGLMDSTAFVQVKAGVESSWSDTQVWRSDLCLSCGILGIGVLSLLAITSLPSVGNSLNWREFTFVQVSRD